MTQIILRAATIARLLVSFPAGLTDVKEQVGMVLGKLNVPVAALFSTFGRTAARGIDAALTMVWLKDFFGQLMDRVKTREVSTFNNERSDPRTWPAECEGVGLVEAPRAPSRTGSGSRTAKSTTTSSWVPTTWNGRRQIKVGETGGT